MQIIERIYLEALPRLRGLTLVDAVIGISFLGVKLSDGSVHFTYLMRECLPSGDAIFPYGVEMIGRPAEEIAKWALTGAEDLQRGLGVAVLCAVAPRDPNTMGKNSDEFYSGINTDSRVGLIGYMPPIIRKLKDRCELLCFDRAVDLKGTTEDIQVCGMEEQEILLPTCDYVVISGTSLINHSLESLLAMSTNARGIIVNGFSLPFYPQAFTDTGVTALGAARFPDRAHEIFKDVSLAAGRHLLRQYSESQFSFV
jgi:uncharacterized protein (DUF4213/DUF364 family)